MHFFITIITYSLILIVLGYFTLNKNIIDQITNKVNEKIDYLNRLY